MRPVLRLQHPVIFLQVSLLRAKNRRSQTRYRAKQKVQRKSVDATVVLSLVTKHTARTCSTPCMTCLQDRWQTTEQQIQELQQQFAGVECQPGKPATPDCQIALRRSCSLCAGVETT